MNAFGGFEEIEKHLNRDFDAAPLFHQAMAREADAPYQVGENEISF
jgi:hypothetical protein